MVWLPGGTFRMGSDDHYPEEAPAHAVSVGGFWIDRHPVTNLHSRASSRPPGTSPRPSASPPAADYPGAKPEMLVPGSVVFQPAPARVDLRNHFNWWHWVAGRGLAPPGGARELAQGQERHPVVHVSYEDARRTPTWTGKALPTEAEWEFAARGGLDGAEYAWGDELAPGGKQMANTWQGEFPCRTSSWTATSAPPPCGAFPPNGYGLLDMIGNVWEWTDDWYQPHAGRTARRLLRARRTRQSTGGDAEASLDPRRPDAAHPPPGDEGRLPPLRPQLLPPLPSRRRAWPTSGHLNLPPGLPLHPPRTGQVTP